MLCGKFFVLGMLNYILANLFFRFVMLLRYHDMQVEVEREEYTDPETGATTGVVLLRKFDNSEVTLAFLAFLILVTISTIALSVRDIVDHMYGTSKDMENDGDEEVVATEDDEKTVPLYERIEV